MSNAGGIVKRVITPNDQLLREVFNRQKCYYIDIYQREYKWTDKNINTLLMDIQVNFELHSRDKTDPAEITADVKENFEPYFLNTYLTHTTASDISIVDGQQRLTSLMLMLIKLYSIIKEIESNDAYPPKSTFASKALEQLIFESDDFGDANRFKIYNENRESTFRALVNNTEIKAADETQRRLLDNYKIISNNFDRYFIDKKTKLYDVVKLTYYISYLLDRISIVEIKIENQKNVATIFEVVNDRGLGLKPYEILKGKFIGSLDHNQKEAANRVWTELQDKFFNAEIKNSTESQINLDMFFQAFFRSKFADSESEYVNFENEYHYEIYQNEKIKKFFGGFKDPEWIYKRIVEDIHYFAELYLYLRTTYDEDYLVFNKLLDQNQQYLLIMSSIELDDPEREEKIKRIARKFDQMHVVLRLLDVYESRTFQDMIYPISRDIRGKNLDEAIEVFDKATIDYLQNKANIIPADRYQCIKDVFEFERFRGMTNKWLNFSKYVLMRIDRWLAEKLDKPSYVSEGLEQTENRFNKNNRRKYGLHLEHIYTWHEKNLQLFTEKGVFDEQSFNRVRNQLGMVLLLKDSQNISSNNEIYKDKLKTYSQSDFIWNELLAGSLPPVDFRCLPDELKNVGKINPTPSGVFPLDQCVERQRALFYAVKSIWGSF